MNIGVIGLGHFAQVVAVCLASAGHLVSNDDEQPYLLRVDQPVAIGEATGLDAEAELYWVAYDVPLDAAGAPEMAEVEARIGRWHARLPMDRPFLVSCQWPVGTTARLEQACPGRVFVYVMENVRTASGIEDFTYQTMAVVGARRLLTAPVMAFLQSLAPRLCLMSPESAELTKHTMNAFLALQIAFINEIARVGVAVGANADAVAEALLADPRVSSAAPLHPGGPFGGGSLRRDLLVLEGITVTHAVNAPILGAILGSNG